MNHANPETVRIEPLGPPRGEVTVCGAKNSALPLIAASLLVDEGTTTIRRVPLVDDVLLFLDLVRRLGVRVETDWSRQTITLDASQLQSDTPDPDLVGRLRSSVLLMAPLLVRLGSVRMARPGGCAIGTRRLDVHLDGLRQLGAEIRDDGAAIEARCQRFVGRKLLLDVPSPTGTQQLLLAAARAEGVSVLSNAAQEPEVERLSRCLVAMGADIAAIGSTRLMVSGVGQLRGSTLSCASSRLETAWFAMAGCLPGANLTIRGAASDAEPVLVKLRQMGARIRSEDRGTLRIAAPRRLRACRVVTWPYPGFPTDSQPPLMALACSAWGRTFIRETVFEHRFQHVDGLRRLGAQILVRGPEAVVGGPRRLIGTTIEATDLQAGAALVLAALAAEGPTTIRGFEHVRRGYPNLLERLPVDCRVEASNGCASACG